MSTFTLRPYQTALVDAVRSRLEQPGSRTLAILPTGAGKTLCAARVAEPYLARGQRVLFLAHRRQLVAQAAAVFRKHIPHYEPDKAWVTPWPPKSRPMTLNGPLPYDIDCHTIQSIHKHLGAPPSDYYALVICDEAHHAAAKQHREVLAHFNGATRHLGITATPDRGDHKKLTDVYPSIAYEASLPDLIEQGFLCPIQANTLPIEIDGRNMPKRAGDIALDKADDALTSPILYDISRAIQRASLFRRKILVFTPTIASATALASHLSTLSTMNADATWGSDPNQAIILKAFAQTHPGSLNVLCNAQLLTEGYDNPAIDCVVLLRPTLSRPLYSQMVGRGTRIHPGKKNLLILDFLWITEKLNLVKPIDLVAPDAETASHGKHLTGDLGDILAQASADRAESMATQVMAARSKKLRLVDAVAAALAMDDPTSASYFPRTKEEAEPLSAEQIAALEKFGIAPETLTCSGHADRLLDFLIRRSASMLASPKQLKLMKKFRIPCGPRTTKAHASAMIGRRMATLRRH